MMHWWRNRLMFYHRINMIIRPSRCSICCPLKFSSLPFGWICGGFTFTYRCTSIRSLKPWGRRASLRWWLNSWKHCFVHVNCDAPDGTIIFECITFQPKLVSHHNVCSNKIMIMVSYFNINPILLFLAKKKQFYCFSYYKIYFMLD